jgi:hypothetical protein
LRLRKKRLPLAYAVGRKVLFVQKIKLETGKCCGK